MERRAAPSISYQLEPWLGLKDVLMLGVVNVVQGTKVRHTVYICGLKDILGVADPCVQVHAGQVLLELPVPLQTLS